MYIDLKSPRASTTLIAFNGMLIGLVVEADTTNGYIVQQVYDQDNGAFTGQTVKKTGRVDIVGDSEKDGPKVIHERMNKIRSELGLELIPTPPFLD